MNRFLFAGLSSGSGKTAVTCACLRALQAEIPTAAQIGYVTELHENYLILE